MRYGPSIVRNGLVLCLDAADRSSYSGSGTRWTDLSGNNNHATLTNSPTIVNNVMRFGGTSYATAASLNLSSGQSTVISAVRYYNGGLYQRTISSQSTNWLLGHYSGNVLACFQNGWLYNPTGGLDFNWRIYASTGNTAANSWAFFSNGALIVRGGITGGQGPNGIVIGRSGIYTGEISTCECGFVLAYNRVLTDAEILQTYNALKGRFQLL
jgi:hypothetical protein